MKKKCLIVFILIVVMSVCFIGCSDNANNTDNTYSAQWAYSPQEYTSFVNKEITPVTNQLVTQIMMSRNMISMEGSKTDALYSAKESLSIVQESYNAIDSMQPAEEYSELRTNAMTHLQEVTNTLETYIKELEKDQPDTSVLQSISSDMETQYTSLTGLLGVYWK